MISYWLLNVSTPGGHDYKSMCSQMPRLPKKLVKVDCKGGTQLSTYCRPMSPCLVAQASES